MPVPARMTSYRLNRRRFLLTAGGALAAGGALYTYWRGVRVPLLSYAGDGPAMQAAAEGQDVAAQGAVFQQSGAGGFRFRAFVPEPVLTVRGDGRREVRVVVENLHPGAELALGEGEVAARTVSEDRSNLTRTVALKAPAEGATLSWRFPKTDQYRFAAIGDTGGGTELHWVLQRAAGLGADFLLHLGDIYYEAGDFDRAGVNLNAAAIPTYAAIGNHDFHKGWRALFPRFHRLVGPSNSRFRLGGIEFINVDTAADFIPAARGRRARLIESMRPIDADPDIRDRVAFTHTPLQDPDPERDHDVGRQAEARWLRERFLAAGTRNLLAGHIHIKEEYDDQGLQTYITGQGLAHADLIVNKPYAEILLGDVEPGAPVRYQWQPLNMPFEAHCNARNLRVLDALERPDVKARLMELCGKA